MGIQTEGGVVERRKYPHIRAIFDEAYRIVYPVLKSRGESGSAASHSMLHQTLHNAFPDLHRQDIPILAASLSRVFHEKHRGDAA
jgi:hypothetical protein